jgi:hypothetical protein
MFSLASGLIYEDDWTVVHINEPPFGNWTYALRTANPIRINASQIQIGSNWTYIYPLEANQSYHIYCYGDWIDDGPLALTDYDVFVYNPMGQLVGYHTEAAGLPEHLGTSPDEPFFTPEFSGNYSFIVRNDPRESDSAEAATFMVIEHLNPNTWNNQFIEGKQGNLSMENTSWACEFLTNSNRIEIQIKVPDSLDMYEARLYLMANPSTRKDMILNGIPLAWEPGLYGEMVSSFGGFNMESEGFRGHAFASCEQFGQDMSINYSTQYGGVSLYHLVLLGESGAGNVNFRIKTDFGDSVLHLVKPIEKVHPYNETLITAVSSKSEIQSAFLHFTNDGWINTTISEMKVSKSMCNTTIPGQEAGTTLSYYVEAYDYLDNVMRINGTFLVKYPTHMNITLDSPTIVLGQNLSISGLMSQPSQPELDRVNLMLISSNGSKLAQYVSVDTNGSFVGSIRPNSLGSWSIQVHFMEDQLRFESFSEIIPFSVVEPSFISKYSIYIAGAGIIAAFVVIFIVIMIRRRQ